jgi:hypothetical protein
VKSSVRTLPDTVHVTEINRSQSSHVTMPAHHIGLYALVEVKNTGNADRVHVKSRTRPGRATQLRPVILSEAKNDRIKRALQAPSFHQSWRW